MSKSANQKIKLVAGALGVIACFFAFVLFFYTAKSHIDYSNSVEIDSTFDVTINDMEFNDILLEGYTFPTIKKGDHVTYTFTLPDKYISDAVLSLYVDHSAIKVYYDDVLSYEMGSPDSKMLGYGYINVDLPEDYTGRTVRVEMDAIENEGRTNLSTPVIYNSEDDLRNYILQNSFYLVIDIAIIVLCLTIMLIGRAHV